MRVRRQDQNNDMSFGGSQRAFFHNVPDGPAQVVTTRLGLFTGQWFLDATQGTPWNTKVLGKYTGSTRDIAIKARIIGTPGVTKIATYNSQLDRNTRKFQVQATLDTAYGVAKIAGPF